MIHDNVPCRACGNLFTYESRQREPKTICSPKCHEPLRVLTPEQRAAKVERVRQWRLANPATNKQQRDAFSEANRLRLRQEAREYYESNTDQILARAKERRDSDAELARAKARAWRAINAEEINEARRAARAADPERWRTKDRNAYWANVEESRERERAYRERVRDADPIGTAARSRDRSRAHYYKDLEASRARARGNAAVRNARKRGGEYERFNPIEIFDRDDWVCHICECRILKSRRFPDPWSASLDHVIPLSKGGGHVRDNVRCSHLRCNNLKNDQDWATDPSDTI